MLNLFYLLCSLTSIAQTCKVSGKINDPSIRELHLYLLEGDTYFTAPSAKWPVAANGSFRQQVSVNYPVFAILKAGNRQRRLLLSPGRDLQIIIDSSLQQPILIKGKGAFENELVQHSILNNAPFFIKRTWTAEELTTANWQSTIIQPLEQDIQSTTVRIQEADIPARLQQILISELYYAYQCYLNDFTAGQLRRSKHPDSRQLLDLAMQWKPLPDSQALVSGFFANMVLDLHARYAAQSVAGKKSDGKKAEDAIADYLQLPFTTIDSLVRNYGERCVLGWLYTRLYMPASIRDKIVSNNILNAANEGSFKTCTYLFNIMQQYYPNSHYLAKAKAVMQQVQVALQSNAANTHIVFKDASNIRSLNELVAPYKGKIVYLDIWGTWCGPCKEEMPYVPELKKRYAGKDIVFVYLDMDNAAKENNWKEYVRFTGLEGEHYRMDQTAIENIWQAIKAAGGQINSYPTFVLIDRDGKIIHPNAARPGSRQELYNQLDKVL